MFFRKNRQHSKLVLSLPLIVTWLSSKRSTVLWRATRLLLVKLTASAGRLLMVFRKYFHVIGLCRGTKAMEVAIWRTHTLRTSLRRLNHGSSKNSTPRKAQSQCVTFRIEPWTKNSLLTYSTWSNRKIWRRQRRLCFQLVLQSPRNPPRSKISENLWKNPVKKVPLKSGFSVTCAAARPCLILQRGPQILARIRCTVG